VQLKFHAHVFRISMNEEENLDSVHKEMHKSEEFTGLEA
jgi:hypothetical protein